MVGCRLSLTWKGRWCQTVKQATWWRASKSSRTLYTFVAKTQHLPFTTHILLVLLCLTAILACSYRTSSSYFLNRTQTPIVTAIEQRIAQYSLLPLENQEPIEVLHYDTQGKSEDHYDFFQDESSTHNGGQRMATVVMYLSDVQEGGETTFYKKSAGFTWKEVSTGLNTLTK